ncbi:hypothetical protein C8R45DRAFT_118273 [Mycena sanguinolenta]|nr:hypothetical protein C8R45DRAFT_194275 [Mycena sanguinolenta]KAJ6450673.1 hypothetical protein C8R45DRAFT_118273 [Mycena sanguinolenta]
MMWRAPHWITITFSRQGGAAVADDTGSAEHILERGGIYLRSSHARHLLHRAIPLALPLQQHLFRSTCPSSSAPRPRTPPSPCCLWISFNSFATPKFRPARHQDVACVPLQRGSRPFVADLDALE